MVVAVVVGPVGALVVGLVVGLVAALEAVLVVGEGGLRCRLVDLAGWWLEHCS